MNYMILRDDLVSDDVEAASDDVEAASEASFVLFGQLRSIAQQLPLYVVTVIPLLSARFARCQAYGC